MIHDHPIFIIYIYIIVTFYSSFQIYFFCKQESLDHFLIQLTLKSRCCLKLDYMYHEDGFLASCSQYIGKVFNTSKSKFNALFSFHTALNVIICKYVRSTYSIVEERMDKPPIYPSTLNPSPPTDQDFKLLGKRLLFAGMLRASIIQNVH